MNHTYAHLVDNIRCKMAARRRVGFFDYHPLSFDQSEAKARAWRLFRRLHGERLTMAQARRS